MFPAGWDHSSGVTGECWSAWVRGCGRRSQPIQRVATNPSAGGWGPCQRVVGLGARSRACPPSGGICPLGLRECRLSGRRWGREGGWLHRLFLGPGPQWGLAWGALGRGPGEGVGLEVGWSWAPWREARSRGHARHQPYGWMAAKSTWVCEQTFHMPYCTETVKANRMP